MREGPGTFTFTIDLSDWELYEPPDSFLANALDRELVLVGD
jgi:hypothetical protein